MPAKVVDASVMGALSFKETEMEEAASLISASELHAPTLLAYELISIARKKVHAYPDQHQAIIEALETALAMDIHWTDVDHIAVLRLALDTGLTTYDASYLYLARTLNAPLVTFDERLARASQDSA